jgi:hypothetical protein
MIRNRARLWEGTLFLSELVDMAAAAAEAVRQGENGVFQLGERGGHPAYHSPFPNK